MNPGAVQSAPPAPPGHPAGGVPVPVWVFVVLGVLGYWGMWYLDGHAGGFHAKVHSPFSDAAYLDHLVPRSSVEADFRRGQIIFKDLCSNCHQPSGLGNAGQAPPLAGSEWVLEPAKPDRLVRIIWNGLSGPITVNGAEWNLQMANIGQSLPLSAADISAVLTFIRGNTAWGNDAPPFTEAQVQAVLDEIKDRQDYWKVEDLLKIPVQ